MRYALCVAIEESEADGHAPVAVDARDAPPPDSDGDGDVAPIPDSTFGQRALNRVDSLLPHIPVMVLIGYYFWHFATLSVEVHDGYGTSGFDIGLYDQGLWLLSRFDAPFVTIMGRNLMGDHTSFILLFLAPLYWLFPGASTLLVVQALVMALGAVPVYLLALKRLGSVFIATLLAGTFLLHPALGLTNLENFHPDCFIVPLAGFAIYYAIEWRPKPFIVFSLLSLLVKEDVVLLIGPLAIWVALRRNPKIGISMLLGSIGYALIATQLWMKNLIGVPTLNTWRIPFGGVRGSIETFIKEPGTVSEYLIDDNRPWYVWQVLAPTGFVFLLQPEIAATGILVLTSNVVSTFVYQHLMAYHYTMALLPPLSMGTVFAISAMRSKRVRYAAVTVTCICSLWAAFLWGLFPWSENEYPHWDPSLPQVQEINEIKEQLPDDAVVSAYHSFVPHVAHRKRVYLWPTPFHAVYWETFEHEGEELPFSDEIEYVFLPQSELSNEDWQRIQSEFELVDENSTAALFKRREAAT